MKKVVLRSLFLWLFLLMQVEGADIDLKLFMEKDSAAIKQRLIDFNVQFQNVPVYTAEMNPEFVWWAGSYLPMKEDSLNIDDLAQKYETAFNVNGAVGRDNVSQRVTYNEGLEYAKKWFCTLTDCLSISNEEYPVIDHMFGGICEKSKDENCPDGYFCSVINYFGNLSVCMPDEIIIEEIGGIKELSCTDNYSCRQKPYYWKADGTPDESYICTDKSDNSEDNPARKYCNREYGGSCNGQAMSAAILFKPLRDVEYNGVNFTREEIEKLLVFSNHYDFLEGWVAVGDFCMNGDLSPDRLGYPVGVNCGDVSPAVLYMASKHTIPEKYENNATKRGFAANFSRNEIWYKHVFRVETEILRDNISFIDAKKCIAGENGLFVFNGKDLCAEYNPCDPETDYNPESSPDGCKAEMDLLTKDSNENNRFVIIRFRADHSGGADDYDAILEIDSNNDVVWQLNNYPAEMPTGGYYVGKSKRLQPDTIQWASGIKPDGNYSGVYWEDVKKLYELSISDGDDIPKEVDNCPNDPNPYEEIENPHLELIKGAIAMGNGYWEDSQTSFRKRYMWQPDHDLDGIGDACDEIDGTVDYDRGYSISKVWRKEPSFTKSKYTNALIADRTIRLDVTGGFFKPAPQMCWEPPEGGTVCSIIPGEHRVHYCGLDLEEYCVDGDWDPQTNKCSNPLQNTWDSSCKTEDLNTAAGDIKISRSHATIDEPIVDIGVRWPHISWDADSKTAENIKYNEVAGHREPLMSQPGFSISIYPAFWSWRADIYAQYDCSTGGRYNFYAICEDDKGTIRQHTPVYYNLSSNYVGESSDYLVNNEINPDYFRNRSTRGDNSDYETVGKWGMATRLDTGPLEAKYFNLTLSSSWNQFKDSYKSFFSQLKVELSASNVKIPLYAWAIDEVLFVKYRNDAYTDGTVSGYSLFSSYITSVPETKQLVDGERPGVTYSIAETGDEIYDLFVNYSPSSDWHKLGTVSNYERYALEWSAATMHNGSMYLAHNNDGSSSASIYKIIRNGDNYELQYVMYIPTGGNDDLRIISAMGSLYFFENSNGLLSSWSIDPDTESYTLITSGVIPVFIRPFNIIGTETGIYIAGKYDPSDPNNTIIAKLSDSNGWQIVQSGVNAETGKLIMNVIDGKLVMTDIFSDNPVTTRTVLDMTDNSVNIEEIETPNIYGIEEDPDIYCLNETDDVLKGGLEVSGECTPFTHPWYRSFSTGSTIYSVAGKGDRLYVGTNTSIKVYDISDPEAFVLKYTFSTNKRVYDLEVAEDNVMYAATSGGIYKLDTTDPDTLSQTSFYSTGYNYQYRIQLYNDLLYVGDDNGINIRDKETFTRLAYVNIDSVLDFSIANGEIALYRSSFWSAGLHIRDVETLNLKAYEYAECYTGELTTDHGVFYLSCDGYEYRFEGRPDTYIDFYSVVGDMLEMQENHVYNGWTYIPDGSNVKLSTLNDVPSYCGNGVIEEGELCDGNSVACTTISSSYVSGTAYCNSTCNGYNESNCEEDGW